MDIGLPRLEGLTTQWYIPSCMDVFKLVSVAYFVGSKQVSHQVSHTVIKPALRKIIDFFLIHCEWNSEQIIF